MSWYPEICYEETEDGITSRIPFVPVPVGEEMPKILFVFESRETGEFEPGFDGEDLPVTELDLHQYADMVVLKQRLSGEHYDVVRHALDLEPLMEASVKGKQITDKIKENIGTSPESNTQFEHGSD